MKSLIKKDLFLSLLSHDGNNSSKYKNSFFTDS